MLSTVFADDLARQMDIMYNSHGDVIKWNLFARCWTFVREFTGDR